MEFLTDVRLPWAAGIVFLTLLAWVWRKLHFHRTLVKGLPGPPHSYLFGSLGSVTKVLAQQPRQAHPGTLPINIQQAYDLPEYFYLDLWPFGEPVLMIMDMDMTNDILLKASLVKGVIVDEFMENFGGPGNLVSTEGAEWKKWRSAFNPGFSPSRLMAQVPAVVDQVRVFADIMKARAKTNELFRMETIVTHLTIDVIGKLVLDLNLDSQRSHNVLVEAFASQIRWQKQNGQFKLSDITEFRRPFVQWYNTFVMNRYVRKKLEERFSSHRETRGDTKHVIDLALEAYLKEVKRQKGGDSGKVQKLDPEFTQAAVSNMKTFIFAGHDTTASTVCYAYYYLSKHPDTLARIRAEHDEIFGQDPEAAADQLSENPHLINKLDYTLAVVKEVLRLQPPANSIRSGRKGYFLRDPQTGESLPTEHFMLILSNHHLQRNPKYWSRPNQFDPSRFLPGSKDDLSAWMPFSKGSRNCIGQEFALIEAKVILALTVRSFNFKPAYDELEKLKGDGTGYEGDTTGIQTQFGEEAYQVARGPAKPREGMPCRLTLV